MSCDSVNFLDNYVNAVDNRTAFPLSGGYIILNSEHTSWTCQSSVYLSGSIPWLSSSFSWYRDQHEAESDVVRELHCK